MPSMFADTEYYRKAIRQSRIESMNMGIIPDINIEEMIIKENGNYSYLLPDYNSVIFDFEHVVDVLNEEIRTFNETFKKYKLIYNHNNFMENAVEKELSERLTCTDESEKIAEEYENKLNEEINSYENEIKKHETLIDYLNGEISKTYDLRDKLESRGIYKRFHKDEYEKEKKELYKKIGELDKLRNKTYEDLHSRKYIQELCCDKKNMLAEVNKPINGCREYAERYLFINSNFKTSYYYAKKADELEQQIKKLPAKDRYFVSTILAEKCHEYVDSVNYNKLHSKKYNLTDWSYMIYTLAESAAKDGLQEAVEYVESLFKNVVLEQDVNRMMDTDLHSQIKINTFMLHAMAFCNNEKADSLLKSIETLLHEQKTRIHKKFRQMVIDGAEELEERKRKISENISNEAQKRRQKIEELRKSSGPSVSLDTSSGKSGYDIEIVYVPNVDNM